MRKNSCRISLADLESRLVLRALCELRDKEKNGGREFDYLDQLILKFCRAMKRGGRLERK